MTDITDRLNKILKTLDNKNIAKEAHRTFKDVTPIKTGNARRNTNLMGNQIDANYPYALPLNQGSSRQAPEGMTVPTIEAIRKYIARELNVNLK